MTEDVVVLVALVVAFAALVTVHVTLVIGLARRPPRWRAPIALVIAPLAPFWGLRERMRVRGTIWIASAAIYAIARIAARR